MEWQDKSLNITGLRKNRRKKVGNCLYRQVSQRSLAVNGKQRNEMIAEGRSEAKKKNLFIFKVGEITELLCAHGNDTEKRRPWVRGLAMACKWQQQILNLDLLSL